MLSESKSLTDMILEEDQVDSKLRDICEQASRLPPEPGEDPRYLVAISAAGVGIEAARMFVARQEFEQIRMLREVIKTLEECLLKTNDDETFAAVTKAKTLFSDRLRDYARAITKSHTDILTEQYQMPAEFVTSGDDVETLDSNALIKIGFRAMVRQPRYFSSWLVLEGTDEYRELQCKCAFHLSTAAGAERRAENSRAMINSAFDKFKSLEVAQKKFGQFIVEESREQLSTLLDGSFLDHREEATTNESAISTFMKFMRDGNSTKD